MSLLGYLIPRIASSGEEPAATQALAYLGSPHETEKIVR